MVHIKTVEDSQISKAIKTSTVCLQRLTATDTPDLAVCPHDKPVIQIQ